MKAILRSGFLVLAILLALAVPANAGPLEDGVAAVQRGDYATALHLLRPLAEQGHAGAQYNLGSMYAQGRGVSRDYTEALRWFRLAAEQRDAGAQNSLGHIYANGLGAPQDLAAAYMWQTLAIAQGVGEARNARDILVKRMTHGQIEEARLMAREWLAEHRQ